MKNMVVRRIAGLLAAVLPAPVFAATFDCYTITGEIPYAVLETNGCSLLNLPNIGAHYPDLEFKASSSTSPSCFIGTFSGIAEPLSGVPAQEVLTGNFYAAQTENDLSFSETTMVAATAATVLHLTGSPEWTGKLYFKDIIINPLTPLAEERLTFVNGEGAFETVKTEGALFIHGSVLLFAIIYNPLLPPSPLPVSGKLCRLR